MKKVNKKTNSLKKIRQMRSCCAVSLKAPELLAEMLAAMRPFLIGLVSCYGHASFLLTYNLCTSYLCILVRHSINATATPFHCFLKLSIFHLLLLQYTLK